MIIKRNGKYFREKLIEEEIPATAALEERIAELEEEVSRLKEHHSITVFKEVSYPDCPIIYPDTYTPMQPLGNTTTPARPFEPIWKIDLDSVTYHK